MLRKKEEEEKNETGYRSRSNNRDENGFNSESLPELI